MNKMSKFFMEEEQREVRKNMGGVSIYQIDKYNFDKVKDFILENSQRVDTKDFGTEIMLFTIKNITNFEEVAEITLDKAMLEKLYSRSTKLFRDIITECSEVYEEFLVTIVKTITRYEELPKDFKEQYFKQVEKIKDETIEEEDNPYLMLVGD